MSASMQGKMRPMPTILAIETSSEIASAALLRDNLIISRATSGVMNHSQAILPMVQSLLQEAGITLADCEAIAFGSGPGSFTGVRTACGVVQGLAFGAALPVIPVVTLLALAEAQREAGSGPNVLCALDARMGEVYWAQYRFDAQHAVWQTVIAPTLSAPSQVRPEHDDGLILAGNGFAAYAGQFNLPATLLESAHDTIPTAHAVARIAQTEFAAQRLCAPADAQPLYLRNKIAQTIAERQAMATR